jgi:primary-amine oxidase
MLVPYGTPETTWFWRNAADQGEYGLGHCATELSLGATAPPHATLLDLPVCAVDGTVSIATNRVAIFERWTESLWSHTNADGVLAGRRSRELCLTFIATVGNYDYRYTWAFRQDGVIEFEVGMTGIMLMAGTDSDRCQSCASETRRSAPGLAIFRPMQSCPAPMPSP